MLRISLAVKLYGGDWSGWDFTNSPKLTVMLMDLELQDRMRGRQGCG